MSSCPPEDVITNCETFCRGFSKEFDPCIDQIVDATLAIHRLVQKSLLPLPHKAHYIFNLRDFSRIVQVSDLECFAISPITCNARLS